MTRHSRFLLITVSAFAIAVTSACGSDDSPTTIAPTSGFLTVGLTDAPVDDAAEVIIVVTGIELPRGPNDTINIDFSSFETAKVSTFLMETRYYQGSINGCA